MSLEITLTASRLIRAPRSRVWEIFSQVTDWASWNPQFRRVRTRDVGRMARGEEFSLWLSLLGLPIMVRARVLDSQPGRRVGWAGKVLGVSTEHYFTFTDTPGGTLVESTERLSGWALLWARPLYSLSKLGKLSQGWLAALAREAETG